MIRGTKRKIENVCQPVSKVTANLDLSIHNRFDIEVLNAKTGEVKQRAQAENVICDTLWTYLLDGTNEYPSRYFNAIAFGSGTGTPAKTDTALFSNIGYKAMPSIGSYNYVDTTKLTTTIDKVNRVYSITGRVQLLETEFNGSTITEVGLVNKYWNSNKPITHAMLKDMNGNQISIAKTNTDIINIYATIFFHWQGNYNGNVLIDYPSALCGCACGLQSYGCLRALSTIYFSANNPQIAYLQKTAAITYDVPNKKGTLTYPRIAAAEGNLGQDGIADIYVDNIHFNQAFATPFDIASEAIATADGVLKDFSTAFGFLTGTPTIYVNGVQESNVVVDNDIPVGGKVGGYFQDCDSTGALTGEKVAYCFYHYIASGNSDNDLGPGLSVYAYNPYYATLGLNTIKFYSAIKISCSNDCATWVDLNSLFTQDDTSKNIFRVPEQYVHYKYWRARNGSTSYAFECCNWMSENRHNIHFAAPPAAGSVITATYKTKHIPKDANHVFDFSVTVGFNEYTA